ncbi:MAG: 4-(cytidine 5'-diphospho)-2-C-methyl-D-erythritol kinase [Bacteroidetes bacterium]|nr:4-(cytidine 5'-diphospho)-2-C-methyl-D-erythritol kinase [Bacteroidota bacterium]
MKNKIIANAKINLILKVLNKRTDGYHNIFSLMHKIHFGDILKIKNIIEGPVIIECNYDIPQEENIVYKAAMALKEYTNCPCGALIKIQKRIPLGAGLGGGSSDAATILEELNNFWHLRLTKSELRNIAVELGSDVPFFLSSRPKWVYGRGEYCKELDCIRMVNGALEQTGFRGRVLVIYPKIHIDTGLAYQSLDRKIIDVKVDNSTYNTLISDYECELEGCSQYAFLKNNMLNDFEEVIFNSYPEVKEIYDYLANLSGGMARLTGSGSSVFAVFKYISQEQIDAIKQKYKDEGKDYLVFASNFVL